MAQPTRLVELPLAHRALHTLPALTQELTCRKGSLWITQDGDTQDIILAPGERFHPLPGRRAIVYALGDSIAVLREPVQPAPALNLPRRSPSARGLVME